VKHRIAPEHCVLNSLRIANIGNDDLAIECARCKDIEGNDLMASVNKLVSYMAPKEACAASYQHPHWNSLSRTLLHAIMP
jgi:hypothetical protein